MARSTTRERHEVVLFDTVRLTRLFRLAATVISWGAKFSEHPLLIADRARNNGQSLLAKTLIDRTRDLAEDLKVHRVPTADHVVTALLIEPLQSRKFITPGTDTVTDIVLTSMISPIEDPEEKQGMIVGAALRP